MNFLAMTVLASLTGLLGAIYVGTLRLRSDDARSFAYRLFRLGFPLSAVGELIGVALFLALIGRFEPLVVLGTPIELELVRLVGGAFVSLGLLGCVGLLVAVGIGIDLGSEFPSVE